ncbi:carbohydrate ABC transporter permease [Streptomyces spiramenti]|uniref:Sugar ABC transporter permease n=1 Tax=Streptomyces spiramenti TaxID=2720606 RepID=A0ABX1AWP9_9ACTN|nr:sugar ABC transporter permease [Streptomyces spiramenti]NJP68735.1 sugar ABC transporter permease [Streptomyces spiramenti]
MADASGPPKAAAGGGTTAPAAGLPADRKETGPAPTGGRPGPGAVTRLRRGLATHWYAWVMVAPVITVIGVIVGWPLVRGLYLTFTDADESNVERRIGVNTIDASYEFVGLQNYVDVLTGGHFWDKLVWTVVWTVSCVVITFVIGLTLANMLNRKVRGRSLYRIALILPWAIPAFVSVFAWRMLYNERSGILNAALEGGGLSAMSWLTDPFWAKVSVIAVNVWLGVPFMLIAMLGALQSIPAEQYEAAEMDGATAWQRFWNITLPGVRSVSATVVLLSSIWTFNMFPVIFLLTGGGPVGSTDILVTEAFKLAFQRSPRDFAGSATWGVLILILLILFALVYRRALRQQGDKEGAW